MKWKLVNNKTGEEIDATDYSIVSDGNLMHAYDDNACGDDECCGPNDSGVTEASGSWEGGMIDRKDIDIIFHEKL